MSLRQVTLAVDLLLLLAAARALSTEESGNAHCGNWQAEYSRLHSTILRGEAPPRYAVSIAVESGFADNVVGLISEFYFALLSNRAFQITTHHPLPSYSAAFDSPNINWTRHVDDPEDVILPVRHLYTGKRTYGPEIDAKKYAGVYLVNQDHLVEAWGKENLRLWPEGGQAETVFLCSNRGRVVSLFDNPYHAKELYKMGLRPDTIFGCGYKFLFEPNAAVKDMFKEYMTPLQSAPSALKIGVGIRAGDAVFNGHKVSIDFADAYIDCALQIEAHWKKQNQPVMWYVMSESLELRTAILEKYGEERTIITDSSTVMQHINCKDYGQNACHPNVTADDALRMAAGQVWVFSATDVQVISKESGFARMGAFLSSRFHNIYSIDGIHSPGHARRCGRTEYDTVEASAQHSSGIR